MNTKIFEFNTRSLPKPLTVCASNFDQASELYGLWSQTHAPFLELGEAEAKVSTWQAMMDVNPQLADAARSGLVGVAYWVGHREGWRIAPADAEPAGIIFPLEPPMKCFVFQDDDMGELLIIAEARRGALLAYEFYIDDLPGWKNAMCAITEISPWLLTGPKVRLRELMDAGWDGVGVPGENGEWTIIPFEEFAKRSGG
ncbi:hypothetical protein [Novosphingobium huizhouense]|uniref:hypothetical protein n=1 Tax=Novosphingobium huizhouense TaxID=2866625 RepID=UPI001CD8C1AC|nr:hypothetical protein [Novosphingobium huizhouense]